MMMRVRGFSVVVLLLFLLGAVLSVAAQTSDSAEIWRGERITFTKEDGADPTLPENQDRITEDVWITRGTNGGQIFNIRVNDRAVKAVSPVDTQWAVGTTEELPELEFQPFRAAVGSPSQVVGKDLVMYLPGENIYIDVRFLSWSQGQRGGFSYERSTPGE